LTRRQSPARVRDRRDGQRNVDEGSVLPHSFEVLDSLAAVNLLEDRGLFILMVERYDDRHRPADGLFGGKAEKPLRAAVPAEDQAVEILREDGVFRRFDNRSIVVGRKLVGTPRALTRSMGGPRCLDLPIPALLIGRLIRTFQSIVLRRAMP
jgi:hypothetical protein